MGISNRLITLRKEKKISQGKLAEMVGIHPNILGRYERGETTPNIDMATKIAEALKVSLDFLVGVTDIELDNSIIQRVVEIQSLPKEDKVHILYALDGLLQNVRTKLAFAK